MLIFFLTNNYHFEHSVFLQSCHKEQLMLSAYYFHNSVSVLHVGILKMFMKKVF